MKRSVLFGSLVAEGSRYQVGQAYAVQLRQNPLLRQINLLPEKEEVAGPALRAKMRLLEAAIPGLGEEIAGASEALGIHPGRLAIFSDRCCQPGRCSQIAALPAITRDGRLYLARSYEYGFADELCLCVTRAAGSPAQAGFSLLLFGRMDGMNDRGLCVTMSTCSFLQPAEGEGLWFPVVLRALLERCATVAEASDLLAQQRRLFAGRPQRPRPGGGDGQCRRRAPPLLSRQRAVAGGHQPLSKRGDAPL